MEMESKLVYYVGEPVLIITDDPDVFCKGVVRVKEFSKGNTFYIVESAGIKYPRFGTAIWPDLPHGIIDDLVSM